MLDTFERRLAAGHAILEAGLLPSPLSCFSRELDAYIFRSKTAICTLLHDHRVRVVGVLPGYRDGGVLYEGTSLSFAAEYIGNLIGTNDVIQLPPINHNMEVYA